MLHLLLQQPLFVLCDQFVHISVLDLEMVPFQLSLQVAQLLGYCHVLADVYCFGVTAPALVAAALPPAGILLMALLLAGRAAFRARVLSEINP